MDINTHNQFLLHATRIQDNRQAEGPPLAGRQERQVLLITGMSNPPPVEMREVEPISEEVGHTFYFSPPFSWLLGGSFY